MAWQTPKTDWAVKYNSAGDYTGDYFEAADYQRIKENLVYLKELGEAVFSAINLPDIPDVTVESFGYASYINALERSLDAIRNATLDPGIPATRTWSDNDTAPLYSDLNRIESATLKFYNIFTATKSALLKLEFAMGGSDF